jgi:hypothetical protein
MKLYSKLDVRNVVGRMNRKEKENVEKEKENVEKEKEKEKEME